MSWCRSNDAELLAVQLPGRAARAKEPPFGSARDAARALMPVVARRLFAPSTHEPFSSNDDATDDTASDSIERVVPWIVVGHSVGSWCAFEFVRLARSLGFPPPALACLSGFPAPDVPTRERSTLNKGRTTPRSKTMRGRGVDEAVLRRTRGDLRADASRDHALDAYLMEMTSAGRRAIPKIERPKSSRRSAGDSPNP